MESSVSTKIGRSSVGDMLSTRGGASAIAAIAAIIAGILLFAFVQRYKSNQNASSAATPVFVAKSLIPAGSSADVIASETLLQRTSVRGSQVQAGAIADPSVLHGKVASVNIYPGQQITAADFTSEKTIASQLGPDQRAIAVPEESAHGLIGYAHAGDHVDVLASYSGANARGSVTTLIRDVLVLSAPSSSSGVGSANSTVVLRVSEQAAPGLAYAADNGKVWITLRPPLGATQTATSTSGH
jgi:Flp pilus assembly protein CpaB